MITHSLGAAAPLRPSHRRRRVVVLGAGPAGLLCAGELVALGHSVTVYESRGEPGGLVRYAIAPYRQLNDPLPAEAAMLAELGVELRLGEAIDTRQALRKLEAEADAIVLTVGMGPDTVVRYPGDELPGVWSSLRFIEQVKAGEITDVARRVGVIGGGNTPVDVARIAVRLGAIDVSLACLRRGRADSVDLDDAPSLLPRQAAWFISALAPGHARPPVAAADRSVDFEH